MAPRYSRVTDKSVEYGFWLIFEEAGGVRLTRTEPNIDRAERSIFMQASLPRSLWRTPSLRGSLTIADTGQPSPLIDVNAASDALQAVLGIDIDLRVVTP